MFPCQSNHAWPPSRSSSAMTALSCRFWFNRTPTQANGTQSTATKISRVRRRNWSQRRRFGLSAMPGIIPKSRHGNRDEPGGSNLSAAVA